MNAPERQLQDPQDAPPRNFALTIKLAQNLWTTLGLPVDTSESKELLNTMVETIMPTDSDGFKPGDAAVQAFLMIANSHALNPWKKEIFAFADKGQVFPIVSIDGWANLINRHPQFDGMEFDYADVNGRQAVTCIIYRKDRSRPMRITEFMDECRGTSKAWAKTPTRMLRHRSIMQAGRICFSIGGIYAQDEVPGYREPGEATEVDPATGAETTLTPTRRAEPPAAPAPKPEPEIIDVQARTVPNATPKAATPEQMMKEAFGDAPITPPARAAAPTQATSTPTTTTPVDDAPATDGEKANLTNKAVAKGIDLKMVLAKFDATLATLTKSQFAAAKSWFATN